MAKFKKGRSGNPSGRPKGSRNKTGNEVREMIGSFIDSKIQILFRKFDKMSLQDQRIFISDLMPYYIPKLQAISNTIDFGNLTDAQLDSIIEKLKESSLP